MIFRAFICCMQILHHGACETYLQRAYSPHHLFCKSRPCGALICNQKEQKESKLRRISMLLDNRLKSGTKKYRVAILTILAPFISL
jgi:hypothetical protein